MAREVTLVASGDLRETANRLGWPAQAATFDAMGVAVHLCGHVQLGPS